MARVNKIAVHCNPHLDEVFGIWLLRRQGAKQYPGATTASIIFWETGGNTPDRRRAAEWEEKEGVLALGIGGGKFDEHGPGDIEPKVGECVASLIATDLGITDDPRLQSLLEYARRVDTTATDSPLALASLIKAMHDAREHTAEFVIEWAIQALDALYQLDQMVAMPTAETCPVLIDTARLLEFDHDHWLKRQLKEAFSDKLNAACGLPRIVQALQGLHDKGTVSNWVRITLQAIKTRQKCFNDAARDFEQAQKKTVTGPKGEVKLVVMKTDNRAASRFARKQGSGITIQQTPRGNIQLFINKSTGVSLVDVARMVRIEEQRRRKRIVTVDFETLGSEGSVPGAECWYYHAEGEMLLNGSLSHRQVEPTKIPIDELVDLVEKGINPHYFDPGFETACRQDVCAASSENPCPLFPYRLPRCHDVRVRERKARAKRW